MVRSTCKVVVRLKPKDDPLDTAVQCIDNTAVCVFSVMYRAAITSAMRLLRPSDHSVSCRSPHCLLEKAQTMMVCTRCANPSCKL